MSLRYETFPPPNWLYYHFDGFINRWTNNFGRSATLAKFPPNEKGHLRAIKASIAPGTANPRSVELMQDAISFIAGECVCDPAVNRDDMKMDRMTVHVTVAADIKMLGRK